MQLFGCVYRSINYKYAEDALRIEFLYESKNVTSNLLFNFFQNKEQLQIVTESL